MSWFLRLDRFASPHMVRSQDRHSSCGVASLLMVNFKMKKHILAAGMAAGAQVSQLPVVGSLIGLSIARSAMDDAVRSEQEVYDMHQRHYGHVRDFNTTGAQWDLYPAILSDLGLGHWETANVGADGLAQAAVDATADGVPLIAVVQWNGSTESHAVVIDETHAQDNAHYLCVCDPWDGELRLVLAQRGTTVNYDADHEPFSFTLFGERHEYTGGNNNGYFDGRIVRRVSV